MEALEAYDTAAAELGLDPDSIVGLRADPRKKDREPFEESDVLKAGWDTWSKKLCDGIRLEEVEGEEQDNHEYCLSFFVP